MKKVLIFLLIGLPIISFAQNDEGIRLQKPYTQLDDQQSLQRGAKFFMSNCLSCHSIRYVRYDQLAKGIGMVDDNGELDKTRVNKELILNGAKLTDSIQTSMTKKAAEQVFGVQPPDLSLVARSRGIDWLYTYFRSFYHDSSQPTGNNNLIFPNTAMPNLFEPMQGRQEPIYKKQVVVIDGQPKEMDVITGLKIVRNGSMDNHQFTQLTTDLVAFLEYVSEPNKLKRYRLGVWILLFLAVFVILTFLLKREYWKNIN